MVDNPVTFKFLMNRTVLNLPGYRGSIIGYVNEERREEECNKLFSKRFPQLDSSITLTKIQKIKNKMLDIIWDLEAEVAIASFACVILEKLILRNVLTKLNIRKAAACALIP
eukprot:UN00739